MTRIILNADVLTDAATKAKIPRHNTLSLKPLTPITMTRNPLKPNAFGSEAPPGTFLSNSSGHIKRWPPGTLFVPKGTRMPSSRDRNIPPQPKIRARTAIATENVCKYSAKLSNFADLTSLSLITPISCQTPTFRRLFPRALCSGAPPTATASSGCSAREVSASPIWRPPRFRSTASR